MKAVDQQQLAHHLGISDRRIRQLEAEGIIERLDGEPVRYDLAVSTRRYRMFARRDADAVGREIEEAAEVADNMFERLRSENDIQKRRQIAEQDGAAIGRLDAAMKLANALAPDHARDLLRTFTSMVVGRAASELLELSGWQLAEAEA